MVFGYFFVQVWIMLGTSAFKQMNNNDEVKEILMQVVCQKMLPATGQPKQVLLHR
jgi:hypothetical protein